MFERLSDKADFAVAGAAVTFPWWAQALAIGVQALVAIFGLIYLLLGVYIRYVSAKRLRDSLKTDFPID